jgi:hypothetical protein
MPARDAGRWLSATLGSLHKLRGVDLEILIVDDGSRDETPSRLAAARRRDPRVRTIRTPARGIVHALNVGLEAARGRWIARIDADDVLHPDRVAVQVAAGESAGWDVVGSTVRCFPTQHIRHGLARFQAWHDGLLTHDEMARDRFVETPLIHPSVTFRADAVRRVGGYRAGDWPEDYDLWLRLFAAGARFGKVARTLTWWRDHPERLTRTAGHCTAAAIRRCKVVHLLAGPLAGERRCWIAGTGRDGKRLGRQLVAAGSTLEGWLDVNPRRLGQRIHGAPVLTLEAADIRGGDCVLVAVGAEGGRAAARALLDTHGLRETVDYWCVA